MIKELIENVDKEPEKVWLMSKNDGDYTKIPAVIIKKPSDGPTVFKVEGTGEIVTTDDYFFQPRD